MTEPEAMAEFLHLITQAKATGEICIDLSPDIQRHALGWRNPHYVAHVYTKHAEVLYAGRVRAFAALALYEFTK